MIDISQTVIEKIKSFGYFIEDINGCLGLYNIEFASNFGYEGRIILISKYLPKEYCCFSIDENTGKVENNRELQDRLTECIEDSEKTERIIVEYLEENVEKIKKFEKNLRKKLVEEL